MRVALKVYFDFIGMMIVFGGNTHNDTSHSFGAKCYSNELLAYDVICDSWHYMNIPSDLRESKYIIVHLYYDLLLHILKFYIINRSCKVWSFRSGV